MTSFVILTTSQASILSSAKRRIESLPNTLSGTQRLRWASPSSNISKSSQRSSKERCQPSRRSRPSWGSPRNHPDEIFRQFVRTVMARDAAAGYKVGKLPPRSRRQLRGLAEGQNALRVQRKGLVHAAVAPPPRLRASGGFGRPNPRLSA